MIVNDLVVTLLYNHVISLLCDLVTTSLRCHVTQEVHADLRKEYVDNHVIMDVCMCDQLSNTNNTSR